MTSGVLLAGFGALLLACMYAVIVRRRRLRRAQLQVSVGYFVDERGVVEVDHGAVLGFDA